MTYSIIQKTQLEGKNRLDAEYYQPEYLKMSAVIQKLNPKSFKEITLIKSGVTPIDRDDSLTSGVVLLKTTDIRNKVLSGNDEFYYIDKKIDERMGETRLKSKDILFNIVGATLEVIGRTAFVPTDFPKANITQAMALLRVRDELFLPEFLFVYLMSKWGQFQKDRIARPTGQFNLNLEELGSFQIPRLNLSFQKNIQTLVEKSLNEGENSENFYYKAENLLLEELGLRDFQSRDDLSFVVSFSEVKKANRIDADYFQPKYAELINNLKKGKVKLFPEIIENVPAIFNPKPDDGYKYVELSNINSSIGVIDGYSEVLGKEAPSRAKRILKQGDVIVSSVEGSLGKVSLVKKEQESYLASTGFFQLRSQEILPEVLLVLAKSLIVKMQLQKRCAGTILMAVPGETLENILIPILPKNIQQKIADLVKQSHEARKKSKELLEEAKRKVEEMIEKAGD